MIDDLPVLTSPAKYPRQARFDAARTEVLERFIRRYELSTRFAVGDFRAALSESRYLSVEAARYALEKQER
jgi:hypothetical protein